MERWNAVYHSKVYERATSNYRVITVNGNGEITARPDLAELQIEVVTESADVSVAQTENATLTNRVIQALLQLRIAREDIQTAFFNVNPQYDYIEGKQTFRGYEVRNAISVKVRDIHKVGLVIDTAIKNGANRISSLQFKIEDEAAYYGKALALAIRNANGKAIAIATTLDLAYFPQPIEVVEESAGGQIYLKVATFSQDAAATPIEPGLITIRATVQVKYQY